MSGTRRSTLNKRRKGALAFFIPWLKRFGVVLVIAVLGIWTGSWLWMSGNMQSGMSWVQAKAENATAQMGFAVENVMVEGRTYTDPEILRGVLDANKGDPLFAFDPVEAREILMKVNWVKDAHVERRFPDTIYVRLEEKTPLALWQKGKDLSLIDADGQVIVTDHLERFRHLVIVMGDDAPSHAAELVRLLGAEEVLKGKVKAAKWMGGRRWDVVFDSGITAKMPENELGLAVRRLAKAEEEDKVLSKAVEVVDLREQGRIIVQAKPEAAKEYKAGYKPESDI